MRFAFITMLLLHTSKLFFLTLFKRILSSKVISFCLRLFYTFFQLFVSKRVEDFQDSSICLSASFFSIFWYIIPFYERVLFLGDVSFSWGIFWSPGHKITVDLYLSTFICNTFLNSNF